MSRTMFLGLSALSVNGALMSDLIAYLNSK
jgi:hypothetical protein